MPRMTVEVLRSRLELAILLQLQGNIIKYMASLELQIQATKTLLKFCEDHDYRVKGVEHLQTCLTALQRDQASEAVKAYHSVPLGGMGCFNDWLPPVRFKNETPEYVSNLFEVLIADWNFSMHKLSEGNG